MKPPKLQSKKRKLIEPAVYDFFGLMDKYEKKEADKIITWLMGRKTDELTAKERGIAQYVINNLGSNIYCKNLTTS